MTDPIKNERFAIVSRVQTVVWSAMRAEVLTLDAAFARGFAGLQLVGPATDSCRAGKERAKAALDLLGIAMPPQKILIAWTPGDLRLDGAYLDLPMAIALAGLVQPSTVALKLGQWLFAGELSLSGEVRASRGIVALAIAAAKSGATGVVIPAANQHELRMLQDLTPRWDSKTHLIEPNAARAFERLKIVPVNHLKEVLDFIRTGNFIRPSDDGNARVAANSKTDNEPANLPDFDDMHMSDDLERLTMVAAAGGHSVLLRGSPGCGKSMWAARLPSVLPPLQTTELLEALTIHSCHSGTIDNRLLRGRVPCRAPHHHASSAALLGSGVEPGELSLAHGGVLFLDELPEFRRDLLEALREPLETGVVTISRRHHKTAWQSRLQLVAACNNCPCGWRGSRRRLCRCSPTAVAGYRSRLSGPLLDRIDLHFNMPEPGVDSRDFIANLRQTTGRSQRLQQKVAAAREFAHARGSQGGVLNRDLTADQVIVASGVPEATLSSWLAKIASPGASTRTLIRSLRVARTLADCDLRAAMQEDDLLQALAWQAGGNALAGDSLDSSC